MPWFHTFKDRCDTRHRLIEFWQYDFVKSYSNYYNFSSISYGRANVLFLNLDVNLREQKSSELQIFIPYQKVEVNFSSSRCWNSTSRYEKSTSTSRGSNPNLELVDMKLAKVEVEINLC